MANIQGTIGNDNAAIDNQFVGGNEVDTFFTGGGGQDFFFDNFNFADRYIIDLPELVPGQPGELYARANPLTIRDDSGSINADLLDITNLVPDREGQQNLSVRATGELGLDLEISFGPNQTIVLSQQLSPSQDDTQIEVIRYNGNTISIQNLVQPLDVQARIADLISEENRAPIEFNPREISLNEDEDPAVINLSTVVGDQDGDKLTYKVESQPGKLGTASISEDGSLTFAPAKDANGDGKIELSASDGFNKPVTFEIPVEILPVNDAPSVSNAVLNLEPGETGSVTIDVNDVDGPNPIVRQAPLIDSTSALGTLVVPSSPEGSKFEFTANADAEGTETFQIEFRDGDDAVGTGLLTVNVAVENTPPVVDPIISINVNEDAGLQTLNLVNNVDDAEGNPLTFALRSDTKLGQVSLDENGLFEFTPDANKSGVDTVEFRVTDGQESVNGEISIQVNAVNDPPSIDSQPVITVQENGAGERLNLSDFVSDVEGDALTFSSNATTTLGDFSVSENGRVDFTPAADQFGSANLAFSVTDGEDTTNGTVRVDVIEQPAGANPPGEGSPPTAVDDSFSTSSETKFFDKGFSIKLKKLVKNDEAGDARIDKKSVDIDEGSVTGGTLEIRGKKAVFIADEGETTGTFSYTVFDKDGLESTPATVTIDGRPRLKLQQVSRASNWLEMMPSGSWRADPGEPTSSTGRHPSGRTCAGMIGCVTGPGPKGRAPASLPACFPHPQRPHCRSPIRAA